MKIVLKKDHLGNWRWSYRDVSGSTVAMSPRSYPSQDAARRSVERFERKVGDVPIKTIA